MSKVVEIKVPDIGDFSGVEVIEVLVSPGDAIDVEQALLTLETDKASMEVPSPMSGTVKEVKVSVGSKVSQGDLILMLELADQAQVGAAETTPTVKEASATSAAPSDAAGGYGGVSLQDVKVPDIGEFSGVDIIEVLVAVGDTVAAGDSLLTLETDKASMEVPSSAAGVIKELKVSVGDKVSQGDLILVIEGAGSSASSASAPAAAAPAAATAAPVGGDAPIKSYTGKVDVQAEVAVLGSGPGGYTAAFRAADLGKKVVLIERNSTLGGVCLNVGCIPSKALLHAAEVIEEARHIGKHGITFAEPKIDLDKLKAFKDGVVGKLTGGLTGLAKQRKVDIVKGEGNFLDSYHIEVVGADGKKTVVGFANCIIAVGSEPVKLPFVPEDPRIVDSTGALELNGIPKHMLVIGGGIIGLEMATVYRALGSKITVVEMLPGIVAGADKDIVKPLFNKLKGEYENIWLETRVTAVDALKSGLKVTFEGKNAPEKPQIYDRILLSVGRTPNGAKISADKAGVKVERGFIAADSQLRTNISHIFAIGDVIGQPMLAHKAVHEGKVAAENCAGHVSHFDAMVIPSVAYTHPEVAWVGITETEAKAKGMKIGKASFPWAASGRALSIDYDQGITKLIFDEETERVIGGGIVGPGAGDLIAEVALAIETHCDPADIGLTVHPHPTLSETVAMAAEMFEGTITDLYAPKKKK